MAVLGCNGLRCVINIILSLCIQHHAHSIIQCNVMKPWADGDYLLQRHGTCVIVIVVTLIPMLMHTYEYIYIYIYIYIGTTYCRGITLLKQFTTESALLKRAHVCMHVCIAAIHSQHILESRSEAQGSPARWAWLDAVWRVVSYVNGQTSCVILHPSRWACANKREKTSAQTPLPLSRPWMCACMYVYASCVV